MTGALRRQRRPNIAVAVVLFLLCLVPGIVYLVIESRPENSVWSIEITLEGEGSRVVPVVRGSVDACRAVFEVLQTLPPAP